MEEFDQFGIPVRMHNITAKHIHAVVRRLYPIVKHWDTIALWASGEGGFHSIRVIITAKKFQQTQQALYAICTPEEFSWMRITCLEERILDTEILADIWIYKAVSRTEYIAQIATSTLFDDKTCSGSVSRFGAERFMVDVEIFGGNYEEKCASILSQLDEEEKEHISFKRLKEAIVLYNK